MLVTIKFKLYQNSVEQEGSRIDESAIAGFLYKEVSGEIGSTHFYYKKIEEGKNFYLILESTWVFILKIWEFYRKFVFLFLELATQTSTFPTQTTLEYRPRHMITALTRAASNKSH